MEFNFKVDCLPPYGSNLSLYDDDIVNSAETFVDDSLVSE